MNTIIKYLEDKELPNDEKLSKQVVLCAAQFCFDNSVLNYVAPKPATSSESSQICPNYQQHKNKTGSEGNAEAVSVSSSAPFVS